MTGCAEIDMPETELACSRRASRALLNVALDVVVALEPVALDDQRRDDGFERASRALQAVSRQLPVVPKREPRRALCLLQLERLASAR